MDAQLEITIIVVSICTSFIISSIVGLVLLYATRSVIKQMVVPLTIEYNKMTSTLKHQADNEDERKIADRELLSEFKMMNRNLESAASQYREVQRFIPSLTDSMAETIEPSSQRMRVAVKKLEDKITAYQSALIKELDEIKELVKT